MITKSVVLDDVPITIIKKARLKNWYLRVRPPEGEVTVTIPYRANMDEVYAFVRSKMPTIKKAREKILSRTEAKHREYISGETHYLWGVPYELQVLHDGNKVRVEKKDGKIFLTVPEQFSLEMKEKVMLEWYRSEMQQAMWAVIERCEARMNLHAAEYRIKNMRTRWGTCNILHRRIWLNLQLAKKPMECLEYIIVHELVHLWERNHTPRFHALVGQYYPNWKETKKLLEK